MIETSSLSIAARGFRNMISSGTGLPEDQILIGHPTEATTTGNSDTTGKHYLNLFFYQVKFDGYPADATVDDPVYIRLYCLVTAFGANESGEINTVMAGENDLRLVGGVMRLVHQNPGLILRDDGGETIGQLQLIPVALSLDDISHIWSTQGDTPYRLSVGYEIALLPVPMEVRVDRSPMVVSVGSEVRAGMEHQDASFGGEMSDDEVVVVTVDTDRPGWAPHICFIYKDACSYFESFDPESDAWKVDFDPYIWIAGVAGAKVTLQWEQWDSDSGKWELLGADHDFTIPEQPDIDAGASTIEPSLCKDAVTVKAYKYEDTDLRKTVITQRRLIASRRYEDVMGNSHVVASNPLVLLFKPAGMA